MTMTEPGHEVGPVGTPPLLMAPATPGDLLPMGIRAWTRTHESGQGNKSQRGADKPSARRGKRPKRRYPHEALVFDTETRDEPGQGLLFGIWRLYVDNLDADPATHLVEEGFFYPDDLPTTDPAGWATLRGYVGTHRASDVAPGKPTELLLWPVSRWIEERLVRYGYKHRDRCRVVGFNLPFDLGVLAQHYGPARPRKGDTGIDYYGGWSLSLVRETGAAGAPVDRRYTPRLRMKSIDPRRTLIGWAPIDDPEPHEQAKGAGGGMFVDLRTLAFALTDKSLTLERACALFGHPYEKQPVEYGVITADMLGYGREDVAATATLYRACLAELAKHPGVDLPPHRLYSPATVGARYLAAMNLAHPLEQFDLSNEFLGGCMSAFYGGRAEARIVRTPVPVVVVDFTSMYPAQNALLRTWEILTALSLELDDVTDHVRGLVDDSSLFERLHDRSTWAADIGVTFVELADINGAVLPVRARYEPPPASEVDSPSIAAGNLGIGINPLHYDGTLTYALPDVLAAALLGSKAFRIVKATRLRAVGTQPGLRPVMLRGAVQLDPCDRDPFLSMIEDRHRVRNNPDIDESERERLELFLKITANATSYGSLARFDRDDKPNHISVDAYGPAGIRLTEKTTSPETPGPFCFPPVAASITAGARLTLAMMETHLTRRGGSYAFMDTDSTAIVATPDGGLVDCPGESDQSLRALSHDEVYDILQAFDDLNPYGPDVTNPDPQLPGSPWKIEKNSTADPLNAYVISAKRYLLYRGDPTSPVLVRDGNMSCPIADVVSGDVAGVEISDWSEHGIGLYLDPLGIRDQQGRRIWIRQAWAYVLQRALGVPATPPVWVTMPALTQFTVSSPRQLRWFGATDSGTPDPLLPRPGGFGILGQTAAGTAIGEKTPMPVTGFTSDQEVWARLDWRDRSTGAPLRVIAADRDEQFEQYSEQVMTGAMELRTLGNILNRYQLRPEHKSLAPDGAAAGPETRGKLRRRPVRAHPASTQLIGKESNKLAERLAGVDDGLSSAVIDYGWIGDSWRDIILPILRLMGASNVSDAVGVDARSVRRWLNGARPHAGHVRLAVAAADKFTRRGSSHDQRPSL